jgi:hypothetical protein
MPSRTSLAGLLTAIAMLAVGIACLLNATEAGSIALRVVNTSLLLLAPLAAVLHPGRARSAWAGFAIFGWAYLLLSLPAFEHVDSLLHPQQIVRATLNRLDRVRRYAPPAVGDRVDVQDFSKKPWAYVRGMVIREYARNCFEVALDDGRKVSECLAAFRMDNREYYLTVGDTLACLLFGLLGSTLARPFIPGTQPS